MLEKIKKLKEEVQKALEGVQDLSMLKKVETKHFGRKSKLSLLMRELGKMSGEEKREMGPILQKTKQELYSALEHKKEELEVASIDWEAERIDVTLPGITNTPRFRQDYGGHGNPVMKVRREVEDIFIGMGFEIADGPDVETEWHNFDALNIPPNHPARDAWDTFWLNEVTSEDDRLLLRAHTSPVQIRYMKTHTPPFRIIVPGRCFRNEATDATHEHTFNQFEALMVGDDVHVGNFKYIAQEFFSKFFEKEINVRLRPSFFPFTEPSFEFDISCMMCGGEGCGVCKKTGWIEIGGAGMVNQAVFEAAGYERGKYQGFAWGWGLDRIAMIKYKIDDVRLFHSGDLRFIRQF